MSPKIASTRSALDFFINMGLQPEKMYLTLVHVFRKPTANEIMMGAKFTNKESVRFMNILEKAKNKLVQNGFHGDKIDINLVAEPYLTVADGIIDQVNKGNYKMVLIGRKRYLQS